MLKSLSEWLIMVVTIMAGIILVKFLASYLPDQLAIVKNLAMAA